MTDGIIYRATVYDSVDVPAASLIGDIDYLRDSFRQSLDFCPHNYYDKLLAGKVVVDMPTLVIDDKVVFVKIPKKMLSVAIPVRDFIDESVLSSTFSKEMFVDLPELYKKYLVENPHE